MARSQIHDSEYDATQSSLNDTSELSGKFQAFIFTYLEQPAIDLNRHKFVFPGR